MNKLKLLHRWAGALCVCLCVGLLWPFAAGAASGIISEAALDNADPVEFSSHVMSVDYGKGVLVVAEAEVMIVDMFIAGEQFTSQVVDSEGEAISIESIYKGQTVMVQGLKLGDGRVVAAMVQVIDGSGVVIKPVHPIQPFE